jgi:hypothetical protein
MLERFERPVKIFCLGMAALLAWQLASVVLRGNPLARVKIPALPTLPGATKEAARTAQKETNAATAGKAATQGTNAASGTNALAKATNAAATSETNQTAAGSVPKKVGPGKSGPPAEMAVQMMGGGMPGGPNGTGMKKVELPADVQARVDKIIDSEIFGPVVRPMPMALLGIAEEEAFIQATNGQSGPVKVGGEMGGIKLLRIGINRVLVAHDGETNELTLFGGIGGESLLPKTTNAPSTITNSTNVASTNAPAKRVSTPSAAGGNPAGNLTLSSKQKETQ